jgi:hypothetical protein
LAKCGVNDEPSSTDLAQLIINSSHKLWNLYKDDIKKYLNKIEINENLDNIILEEIKGDNNLIAIKIGHNSEENNSYHLASVKEIYLNDNKVYQQVLNPLIAPKNLESLYKVWIINNNLFILLWYFYLCALLNFRNWDVNRYMSL